MHRNNRSNKVVDGAERDRLAGKRFVTLIRQSDDTDGEQSVEAQQVYLDGYGLRRGMAAAADGRVVLPGVTGSLPGNRSDLEELLRRKREKNDFEVLLVQKIDRMTRGGGTHGFHIEWEFLKLGVEIIYPGDNLPEGPYQPVIKMMKYESAREQASSTGQRGAQGQQYALEQNRMAPFSHTPFGCWRLYLSADDRPLYIIRNLGDGRQEKLDPNDLRIIDTFGEIGGGSRGHHKKQKHEKPFALPGGPAQLEAAKKMLRWRWIDGIGGVRIAVQLNEMGILSPWGKQWSQRMVESITENPIYLGRSVANMTSAAIYFMRNSGAPIAVNHDPQVLAVAEHAPRRHRPPEDWFWRDEPFMADFLDEELRAAMESKVMALLYERWDRRVNGIHLKKGQRTRNDSPYLLSNLMTAVQDDSTNPETMIGHISGPKGGPYLRYYRHKQGKARCIRNSVFNKMIPADALETEVLRVVRGVLLEAPSLKSTLVERLKAAAAEAQAVTPDDLAVLRQKREEIRSRRQALARTFDEAAIADIAPVLQELTEEAGRLDRQIREAEAKQKAVALDPEQVANEMIARLMNTANKLDSLTSLQLKSLVAALVEEAKADLETKQVSLRLVLPEWAKLAEAGLCPASNSRLPTGHQTQLGVELKATAWPGFRVVLANYVCKYIHSRGSNRPVCYQCRRTSRRAGLQELGPGDWR